MSSTAAIIRRYEKKSKEKVKGTGSNSRKWYRRHHYYRSTRPKVIEKPGKRKVFT